jgi:hypothetical protein
MNENERAAEPPTEAAASAGRESGAQQGRPERKTSEAKQPGEASGARTSGTEPAETKDSANTPSPPSGAGSRTPGADEPDSPSEESGTSEKSEASETGEPPWRPAEPTAGEGDLAAETERTTEFAHEAGGQGEATEELGLGDRPARGTMRFQDPDTAEPRPPTLAEQRARQRAEREEREREEAEQAEAARKAKKRKRLLIGGGVTVGVAALVAAGYAIASPEEVNATCVDSNNVAVAENDCDDAYVASHGGYNSGGIFFLPGFGQYRYYYGGSPVGIGQTVSGGTFTKPDNATIKTGSGKTVQRGGFGIKGGSSGKSGGS